MKFAETKNAALLVAATGLLLILPDHYPDEASPISIRTCFWVGAASLALSSVICLISFIPHLEIPGMDSTEKPNADDNIMFFRHIAKYSPSEFLTALHQAEGSKAEINKVQSDLAAQVIANACISLKKFRYYALASWLVGVGILALSIGAIQILAQ